MHSNLIHKTRNRTVEIHLRSRDKVAGRILDVDDVFIEVEVQADGKGGSFCGERAAFDSPPSGFSKTRILLNIADISLIC